MYVKDFFDLNIYKIALQLSLEIGEMVCCIPYHWNTPECDQILRSSSSVHANIAEGFSQRFYPKKFIHYLYIALGSSDETANHLRKLMLRKNVNPVNGEKLLKKYKDLSIKIVNFITYLREKHTL